MEDPTSFMFRLKIVHYSKNSSAPMCNKYCIALSSCNQQELCAVFEDVL